MEKIALIDPSDRRMRLKSFHYGHLFFSDMLVNGTPDAGDEGLFDSEKQALLFLDEVRKMNYKHFHDIKDDVFDSLEDNLRKLEDLELATIECK